MKQYKLYTGLTAVWAMSNGGFKECKQIDTGTTGTWWFETKVLLGCAEHFSISQPTACNFAVSVNTYNSHQATARSSKTPTANYPHSTEQLTDKVSTLLGDKEPNIFWWTLKTELSKDLRWIRNNNFLLTNVSQYLLDMQLRRCCLTSFTMLT